VIVHLLARQPAEVARMVQQLEGVEGVVGVELGVDSDAAPGLVAEFAQAAGGELPVILRLPMERALELASAAIQAGAAAVSLAAPRGLYPTQAGELLQGRLYGPAILPMALNIVSELVQRGIPTIAAGGVYSAEQSKAMLSTGAMAVQLDGILWREAGTRIFE
jgi:dihydroorotate dehydrogenase